MTENQQQYFGEFLGTFIIVFFGCGAVATSVLFNAYAGLFQVAIIWGAAIAMAIFATRSFSHSHLNPAVSISMCMCKRLRINKLLMYILSQTIGAILAAWVLYFIFNDAIILFEQRHNIIRGEANSIQTAMFFGEFFPNPSFSKNLNVSQYQAMFMEGFGTFIFIFIILRLREQKEVIYKYGPLLIGLTITILIAIISPFTQAGFNPARDFGPRIIAYFYGWGNVAFPKPAYSFLLVYILSPIIGGLLASNFNQLLLKKHK